MHSRRRSLALTAATTFALASSLLAISCRDDSTAPKANNAGEGYVLPEGGVFTRGALLGSIAACVTEKTRAFQSSVRTFATSVTSATQDPTLHPQAELAWKSAMAEWQVLEALRFGPAAPKALPGGKDLRDLIYSWPLRGPCLVDEALASKVYESPKFAEGLVTTRTFLAAEYLLFHRDPTNACAATSKINSEGTWSALGAGEIETRKIAYANAVASDLLVRANALADAWDPTRGNFAGDLANPGGKGSAFGSEAFALNSVSDALFYVDAELKDEKIGRPAGLYDCTSGTCPDSVESLYAGSSKDHVRHNLEGFRILFLGCGPGASGLGFDDYLEALGQRSLAVAMENALTDAFTALDAIEEPDLVPALATDPESVRRLHAAVKALTDLLKTQFVSILDLELPQKIEGDND